MALGFWSRAGSCFDGCGREAVVTSITRRCCDVYPNMLFGSQDLSSSLTSFGAHLLCEGCGKVLLSSGWFLYQCYLQNRRTS